MEDKFNLNHLNNDQLNRLLRVAKGESCGICHEQVKEEFAAYGDKFCSKECLDEAGRQLDAFGS